MLTVDRICELPVGFLPCDFRVKWADSDWERTQAMALRRAVFCVEQGIFVGDDRDPVDDHAQLLVAVSQVGGMADQVVGTVRIHRADDDDALTRTASTCTALTRDALTTDSVPRGSVPRGSPTRDDSSGSGVWWGSRLAVHVAFRHHGRIGATLVRLAVSSAVACGCERFLAQVQLQNLALFERMNWRVLGRQEVHGRPHGLMQADLTHDLPCADPRRGYATQSRTRVG